VKIWQAHSVGADWQRRFLTAGFRQVAKDVANEVHAGVALQVHHPPHMAQGHYPSALGAGFQ
jgi:hypothetical protein